MSVAKRRALPIELIEPGTTFEGLVSFRGSARIAGRLTGQVIAEGVLSIGKEAVVRAGIVVDDLIVAGVLEGDVVARRRIELAPTARVTGALRAPRLVVADGSVVDGRCEAGQAAAR